MTLTGVTNATAYRVRARAKNALGTADWRESDDLPSISTPGRIADIDVDRADGALIVSWTIPAGGWLTYDVECSADDGATWTATCARGAASSTATTYDVTLTGVTNATAYRVRARAKNALGTADWRETGSLPAISAPQRIAAIDVERADGSLIVSWTIPAGGWLTYDVECSADGGSTWDATCTRGVSTTTATTYAETLSGVTNATAYKVRARAKNTLGVADWRESDDLPSISTPGRIADIDVDRADDSLIVGWPIPAGNWLTYDVECSDDGGATWTATCARGIGTTTATTYAETLSGVTNSTAYKVRARAKNALGVADWRESGDVPAIFAPARIAEIHATRPAASTLALSWAIPSGGWLSYDVECSADGGATWTATCTRGVSTTTATTYAETLTGVTNSTAYKVRARAKNALGVADWRESDDLPSISTPGRIADIDVDRADGALIVSWTIPAGGWLTYDVECSADDGATWTATCTRGVSTTTATTYSETLTGVSNATAYRVRARAKNALGIGDWRASGDVPAIFAPARIAEIHATRPATSTLALSWAIPNGGWLSYDVECSADGGATWTATCARGAATTTATTYEVTLTGVTNVTPYKVRARAKNALGAADWRESDSLPTISAPQRIAAISRDSANHVHHRAVLAHPRRRLAVLRHTVQRRRRRHVDGDLYPRRWDNDVRQDVQRDADRRDQTRPRTRFGREPRMRSEAPIGARPTICHPSRLPAESPTSTSTAPTAR